MNTIKSVTVKVNGHSINTLQGGDFAGSSIIFLHGKAFQAETWLELGTLQAAIDAGFSVLALDLPGFGKSPEADTGPEEVISEVSRETDLEKFILVGPSMGGKIAMEYSLNHPDHVAGLVLIGAVGVAENRSRLGELPSSSLFIWGENDQISDPDNGRLLHDSVDGSQLVLFKDAKHPCYLEQPELWHTTLLDFSKTVTIK
ncbi:MAG: alpha/beta hydrolase [Thermodesulfobacteriota bacterium]